jgi:hypothetical protein
VRLTSIFVWAENCHLQQILTLLANLDAIVQLQSGRKHLSDSFPYFGMDEFTDYAGNTNSGKSKSGFRRVLADLSPKWIKAFS